MERERLGSRIGFILLSAGCAIGCGNIWKFPWMCGQYGGGIFVLIYLFFLALIGLPIMTMEFSMGRAAQTSSVGMYQKLEKPGTKWHAHGYASLCGNVALMAFYTVVTGWMVYYFLKFALGEGSSLNFDAMLASPKVNIVFLAVVVALGFLILCFNLQKGLERVTKVMMTILLLLIVVLAVRSIMLPGAAEGLKFYLVPDLSKINGSVVVAAMNQSLFTLSLGIGSMAIFGSYIDKSRSLMGESVRVIALDTFVAIFAGLIIFPSCTTYGIEVDAGPSLLFTTMATVFNKMPGGRIWGSLFFLFMTFAAFSTVIGVFETILACFRELTGKSRPKGALICGIVIFLLGLTTALGYNVWSGFHPFAADSFVLDVWDFLVSYNFLPLGSLIYVIFCTNKRYGWGFDNFLEEANCGKGMKMKRFMRPYLTYVVPLIMIFIYVYGMVTFDWR